MRLPARPARRASNSFSSSLYLEVLFSGFVTSSISPRRRAARIFDSSSRMRPRRRSCSAMRRASWAASFEPIAAVPLNIMCSKRWLIPVMPGRSFGPMSIELKADSHPVQGVIDIDAAWRDLQRREGG